MLTIENIKKYFRCDLAIDLGTDRTAIIDPERGVLIDEASAVAIQEIRGQIIVVAVGDEAYSMRGKEARGHRVIFPLKNGVVSDADIAEFMLTTFIERAMKSHPNKLFKPNPRIIITVPSYATQIEKRSVKDLALKAGASDVQLIEQSLAAGLGADLDIHENNGHLIVHIGADVTEVSVLSMGDVVTNHTIEVGGSHFTDAIKQHFRQNHKISLSDCVAEKIKIKLGMATYPEFTLDEEDNRVYETIVVSAIDITTNIPKEVSISQFDVYKALINTLSEIMGGFMESLIGLSPEISSDLLKNGIHLSGGGAKLEKLKDFFEKVTGLKVVLLEDSEYVAVRGCLSYFDEYLYDE